MPKDIGKPRELLCDVSGYPWQKPVGVGSELGKPGESNCGLSRGLAARSHGGREVGVKSCHALA